MKLTFLAALVLLALTACGGRSTEVPTVPAPTAPGASTTTNVPSPTGQPGSEGLVLGKDSGQETVYPGALCDPETPVREYSVVAVNVEITLNRFSDYDPQGRMYVLDGELDRVRREEAQNREARPGTVEPAVSLGLQGDAIHTASNVGIGPKVGFVHEEDLGTTLLGKRPKKRLLKAKEEARKAFILQYSQIRPAAGH